MALHEPNDESINKRKLAPILYISIFVILTGAISVVLAIRGNIPFDPITALIAGLMAGFALVIFQLTYVKFIVRSSWRIKGKSID